jgi:hypothetical protein
MRLNKITKEQAIIGSGFKVQDKEGIKDSKSWLKRSSLPNNCQFGSKFRIGPDQADVFLPKTLPECNPGARMQL